MEANVIEQKLQTKTKKKTNRSEWHSGMKDGLPIALGYIAVSFTFGIIAVQAGLTSFQSGVISATNFTSAGQFAGLTLIATTATFLEVALTQLIINSRYFLMSASLSQKIDPKTPIWQRCLMAFGISDEVFAVSLARKGTLNPFYTYGLITIALAGWIFGTVLGAVSGNILPERATNALSIALYGMLIAVIIPPAKGNKLLTSIIAISMFTSFLFTQIPFLSGISSGAKIIILTIVIAGIAAILFPVKEDSNEQ